MNSHDICLIWIILETVKFFAMFVEKSLIPKLNLNKITLQTCKTFFLCLVELPLIKSAKFASSDLSVGTGYLIT